MARPKKGVTFHDRVAAGTMFNARTGCHEWMGHRDDCGYGRINRDGRLVRLHRETWKDIHGDIPRGLCVCHHCDNPSCINPEHLFLGTHQDNMTDKAAKGRVVIKRGSQNPVAKLNETQVEAIKKRLFLGETCKELGRAFGVSEGNIRHIKKNRKWQHVLVGGADGG